MGKQVTDAATKVIMFAFIGDELHYRTSLRLSHSYWLMECHGIKTHGAYESTIMGKMHCTKTGVCLCTASKGTNSEETPLTARQIAALAKLWNRQFPDIDKLCILSGQRRRLGDVPPDEMDRNMGDVPVIKIDKYDRHGNHFMDYAELWRNIDYKNAIEGFAEIHADWLLRQHEGNPMPIIYDN